MAVASAVETFSPNRNPFQHLDHASNLRSSASTSTSSSCITPRTTPMLSKNPLTETRSIRFVVALYSVRSTVFSSSELSPSNLQSPEASPIGKWASAAGCTASASFSVKDTRENERRTKEESSASTWSARRADEASLWVGSGMEMTLVVDEDKIGFGALDTTHKEHGKSGSTMDALEGGSVVWQFIEMEILHGISREMGPICQLSCQPLAAALRMPIPQRLAS